jgi:hypothetical protein
MASLTCPKCGKKFNSNDLRVFKCKDCRSWLDFDEQQSTKSIDLEPAVEDPIANLDPATREVVLASNRTTYAVRSLSLYLFISITTSFLGLMVIYLAPEAALLGSITILIGFITAISVGISELNKSKP